ncbi:MAG: hypothetical protein ACYC1D_01330 [Acidimicrobiales bacterium]
MFCAVLPGGWQLRRSIVKGTVTVLILALGLWLWPMVNAGVPALALSLPTGPLAGVFSVESGSCNLLGPPSGSYVELLEHGLPVPNISSPCPLTSSFYTPLKTGAIGLVSGAYQLDPSPTFNGGGGSLANAIVTPVPFLGVGFSLATTCADQQHQATPTGACATSGTRFPIPQLYAEPVGTAGCKLSLTNLTGLLNDCLYGNLEGLGVTYNGSHGGTCASAGANNNGCYDTGAATGPGLNATSCGSAPLGGCSLSGTLNPLTGAYSLDVSSTIVGTAFSGASAVFHLVGQYTAGIPAKTTSGEPSSPATQAPSTPPASPPSAPPSGSSSAGSGPSGRAMTGQFQIAAGSCQGSGAPGGSWIQLGLGGSPITNPASPCDGGRYTPVSQGTAGLEMGQFQPNPTPTFDASGNSLADAILTPAPFLGTKFGAASDPQDEQSAPGGPSVFPAPQAVLNGSTITANLSAINFTYNGTPNGTCASGAGDGCYAVGSAAVSGTYDASTRSYTLGWTATIHGGAFNNATATFHLAGTFAGTLSASATQLSQAGASVPAPSGQSSAVNAASGVGSAGSAVQAGSAPAGVPQANEMVGTFTIAAGACAGGGAPGGSWIQLSKGGAPIPNPNSSCDGGNFTPISQGTQGLQTGQFQREPVPTFDASGNSLANAIIQPAKFLGTDFGAGTDPQNEQNAPNGPAVFPAPYAVLAADQASFAANLSAINFTYNGTPNGTCASGGGDGCYAVGSANVAGTYNPSTHEYTMAWSGNVVGGAFSGATASFHLTGNFNGTITKVAASTVPVASAATSTSAPGAAAGSSRSTGSSSAVAPPGGAPSQVGLFPVQARKDLPGSGPGPLLEAIATVVAALAIVGVALFGRRRLRPL